MTRWLSILIIVIFSVGWLVPVYLGFAFLHSWCVLEAAPVVYDLDRQGNSFPFLAMSYRNWQIGMAWLSTVALFWSSIGAYRIVQRRDSA